MKIIIDMTNTLDKIINSTRAEERAKVKQVKPRKASPERDKRSEDLELRLMACGSASDVEVMQLEMDVSAFVSEQLASGKKKPALEFLNANKHRFTPEMKDNLTDIINGGL